MNRPGAQAFNPFFHDVTRRNRWVSLVVALAAIQLAGCMSNQPAPGSVRNTGATAPADLQLACASAAATPLGVESTAVLPVSSSQVDDKTFQVVLEAKGARANCVVDTAGTVISVQKV